MDCFSYVSNSTNNNTVYQYSIYPSQKFNDGFSGNVGHTKKIKIVHVFEFMHKDGRNIALAHHDGNAFCVVLACHEGYADLTAHGHYLSQDSQES